MRKRCAFWVSIAMVMGWLWSGMSPGGVAFGQEIVLVHGHNGHIEYQDRVDSGRQFLGWGLDFDQQSGLVNWIHYSIPVPYGKQVQYVGVLFATSSVDVSITQIHVYNGSNRIYVEDGLLLNGSKRWYVVDMGAPRTITEGLGLSIEVGAGVEMMSHNVEIYAVGAQYE